MQHCPRFERPMTGDQYKLCRNEIPDFPSAQRCFTLTRWAQQAVTLRAQHAAAAEALRNDPKLPSLYRRGLNFMRDFAKHAGAGFVVTSALGQQRRRAICDTCNYRNRQADACSLCGCPVNSMIRWAIKKCPDNPPRWLAEEPTRDSVVEPVPDEDDLRLYEHDLNGATRLPALPVFLSAQFLVRNFGSLYAGQTAIFLGRGPSLADMDLEAIRRSGLLTIAVNNATEIYSDPHIYMCIDNPSDFPGSHWRSLATQKLIPYEWVRGEVPGSGPVRAFANTSYFVRNARFRADMFLTEPTFNVGADPERPDDAGVAGARSVMFPMIKAAYILGVRRLILLGCDFRMNEEQPYADSATKGDAGVRSNNDAYRILNDRFTRLRPYLESAGLTVVNATPNSRLDAFPRVSLAHTLDSLASNTYYGV
jgi:hypothetical protein